MLEAATKMITTMARVEQDYPKSHLDIYDSQFPLKVPTFLARWAFEGSQASFPERQRSREAIIVVDSCNNAVMLLEGLAMAKTPIMP